MTSTNEPREGSLTDLIQSFDPLVAMFVADAVTKTAQRLAELDEDEVESLFRNSFVHGTAWVAAAQRAAKAVTEVGVA